MKRIMQYRSIIGVIRARQYLLKASKAKLEVSTAKEVLFIRIAPPVLRPASEGICFAKQSEQWLTETTAQSRRS